MNQGTLKGNTIFAKSKSIVNKGTIFGNDISLKASQDIVQSGIIEGENKVSLDAGRNISMKDTIQHGKNQDILDTTAGIAVKGKEGMLFLQAGKNITLIWGLSWQSYMKIPLVGQFHHGYKDDLANKKDTTETGKYYIRNRGRVIFCCYALYIKTILLLYKK